MTSKIERGAETVNSAPGIETHRKAYLDQLARQGYSEGSLCNYRRTTKRFCAEFIEQTVGNKAMDQIAIEAIKKRVIDATNAGSLAQAKCCLRRFIDYLIGAGVISPAEEPVVETTAKETLRVEYSDYLRRQRGLSEASIYHCMRFFERFMTFRFGEAMGDLEAIRPDDIISFLRQLRANKQPYRERSAPSHLRNLFHFFFWSGKTKRNLASSIPRIAQHPPANLPRYLKPDEIQRLIDAALTNNAIGRRNYAMLLLLARLGLRAPEVITIQLEDIDWRGGEILIRGKGKLHDRMPLPEEVGNAIVNYIQNGRRGDSRSLFVSDGAPHKAFKDAQIINDVLKKAFAKTGLKPPQKNIGSHLLRHSLATDLLSKGASLEEIGHVLRHRSRVTTMIYAKCNISALRTLAQAWPVEGAVV